MVAAVRRSSPSLLPMVSKNGCRIFFKLKLFTCSCLFLIPLGYCLKMNWKGQWRYLFAQQIDAYKGRKATQQGVFQSKKKFLAFRQQDTNFLFTVCDCIQLLKCAIKAPVTVFPLLLGVAAANRLPPSVPVLSILFSHTNYLHASPLWQLLTYNYLKYSQTRLK